MRYKNNSIHRHILHKNIIHPLSHSTTYSSIYFGNYWFDNILFVIPLIFLSSLNLYFLSFYDITLNLNIIFFDFIFVLIFLIFLSYYFYNVIWVNSYFYNSDYLWRCFRINQQLNLNSWNWMKDEATLDILNYYTKQLKSIDYISQNQFTKNDMNYEKLVGEFLKFNKQKDNSINIIFDLKNKVSNKKNNYINQILEIKSFIFKLNKFKKQINFGLFSSLSKDLTSSLIFDYNRYIYDVHYLRYYQIILEDSLKLNIFISRGLKRDDFIKQIFYQEDETFPEMLSLDNERANLILEQNWNKFLDWMFRLDLLLYKNMPTWIINKDVGGLFLHVNRLDTEKNVYFFNQNSNTFDILALFLIIVPLFIFQYFLIFYYPLHFKYKMAVVQDYFIIWKLKICNWLPVFMQEWLKDLGIFSWSWKTNSRYTIGNGYPKFMFNYSDHIFRDFYVLDPLYLYDTIFADLQKQVIYYKGDCYYKKYNNNWILLCFFKQQFILIKDFFFFTNFSYKWFFYTFTNKFIWLIFFVFYLIFVKNINISFTNVKLRHLIYLNKIYNINKIKWNNYINKIWF